VVVSDVRDQDDGDTAGAETQLLNVTKLVAATTAQSELRAITNTNSDECMARSFWLLARGARVPAAHTTDDSETCDVRLLLVNINKPQAATARARAREPRAKTAAPALFECADGRSRSRLGSLSLSLCLLSFLLSCFRLKFSLRKRW
jgi:hypothetical protein